MFSMEHINNYLPFSKISGSSLSNISARNIMENLRLNYILTDRTTNVDTSYTIQLNENDYTIESLVTTFNTVSNNIKLLQTDSKSLLLCIPWPYTLTLRSTRLLQLCGFSVKIETPYEFFVVSTRAPRIEFFYLWSQSYTMNKKSNLCFTPAIDCKVLFSATSNMEYTYKGHTTTLINFQEVSLSARDSIIFTNVTRTLETTFTIYVQDIPFQEYPTVRTLIPYKKVVYAIDQVNSVGFPNGLPSLNTTYEELLPMHLHLEVIGAGHTAYGQNTYGGAGASVVEKISNVENKLVDFFPANAPGEKSVVNINEEVFIIAGGGGKGGSDAIGIQPQPDPNGAFQPATGGSAESLNGHNGFGPVYKHKSIPELIGTGAKQYENGISSNESTGGGQGLFRGGHGGSREIVSNIILYGGSGSGSCKAHNLANVKFLKPLHAKTQPEAQKGYLNSLYYGNGGSKKYIAGHTLGLPYSYSNGVKTKQAPRLKNLANNDTDAFGPGIIAGELNCHVSNKYTILKYITNNAGTFTTYTSGLINLSETYTDAQILNLLPQMAISTLDGKSYLQLPNLPTAIIGDYSTSVIQRTEMYRDVLNALGFSNVQLSHVRVLKVLIATPTDSAIFEVIEDQPSYTIGSLVSAINGLGLSITAHNESGKLWIEGPVAFVDQPGWHSLDLIKGLGFHESYLYLYNNVYFSEDLVADNAPSLENSLVFYDASTMASLSIFKHIRDPLERNSFTVYTSSSGLYLTNNFVTNIGLYGNIVNRPAILLKENNSIEGIAYFNASNGRITVYDGITSTAINLTSYASSNGAVFWYGRKLYALVPLNSTFYLDIIMYNLDTGVSTSIYTGPTLAAVSPIVANDNTNVVVILNNILYYSALSSFTSLNLGTISLQLDEICMDVRYSGTQFVLCTGGPGVNSIFTSTDAIHWTIILTNPFSTRPILTFATRKNQIVVGCYSSSGSGNSQIYVSHDNGSSWTNSTIFSDATILSITFHWPRWIMCLQDDTLFTYTFYESTDAITWSPISGSSNHNPNFMIST